MKVFLTYALLTCVVQLIPTPAQAVIRFELKDGDRVVFLGSGVIEQEQRYGYWEAALTCLWPDRNITFRNLGWSGDTVWGDARAGFETPREGYQRLVAQTVSLKPTVIFLGYGMNESFAGEAGLPGFQQQLEKLLDDLSLTKARVVLLAPPMFEKAKWIGDTFEQRERDLKLYSEAIRKIAQKRHLRFVNEFSQRYSLVGPLTTDGMHLSASGYWATAHNFLNELCRPVRRFKDVELEGTTAKQVVQELLIQSQVPLLADRDKVGYQLEGFVKAHGLKPGLYTLQIDGQSLDAASADKWARPHSLWQSPMLQGPSLQQAEKLRQAIVDKNRLYFDRWRPQNETYLFGFRRAEQGQNAREIPQFDPLIAEKEKEIARLRKPVPHTYQLVPAAEEKK